MPETQVDAPSEKEDSAGLRPRTLFEYVGQPLLKSNLEIAISAAQSRGEPLDHTLLYGPPGLGKTTLANILAAEMGVKVKVTSGPAIERAGDMVSTLTQLREGNILFIDEIHRLSRVVEEVLYPAMEDNFVSWVIDKGLKARTMNLSIKPFTLVGATTRFGMMSAPLRDRFGSIYRLDFYEEEAMKTIVGRSARILGVEIADEGLAEISRRSRGTPRIANRLLRRVRDYAQVMADGAITLDVAKAALERMDVDDAGLDNIDRRVLRTIIEKFDGGPVGLNTIAASLSEDADTIEDVCEPYLLNLGFLDRSPRGRVVTKLAYKHLGLAAKTSLPDAKKKGGDFGKTQEQGAA